MTHNLAWPWTDACSRPQTPFLCFHSPQSDNLMFSEGAVIELRCQSGLRAVSLKWTLYRNLIKTPFREGVAEPLPGNKFTIRLDTAGLQPGFYDLRVELDTGMANTSTDPFAKRPVSGVSTFGWRVDRMAIADTRPQDFTAFWTAAKAELAAIPLDAREGAMQVFGPDEINAYNATNAFLPPDYDPDGHRAEEVESCKVDFAGPDGGRVYGYLASRPDVDASRIVVVGGSQGGRLGVVVAGRDPRVKAVVATIPHYGNHPYQAWAGRYNARRANDGLTDPALAADGMGLSAAPPVANDPASLREAYYDPMNFAPDANCPVMFNAGLSTRPRRPTASSPPSTAGAAGTRRWWPSTATATTGPPSSTDAPFAGSTASSTTITVDSNVHAASGDIA